MFLLPSEVYMSPKDEYFCTTPKNGSAQECGSKGGPHGNISARKSNISAQNPKNTFFLHGEIRNLPPIIQLVNFGPFFVNKGTRKRMKIASMYIVFGLV